MWGKPRGGSSPLIRTLIEELDREEIDAFLRRQVIGRIGCSADGEIYVVPVIYVWDGAAVYVMSVEGRKIRMMRENPHVVFEVDEYESADGSWRSVILDGVYEELEGTRAEAALALLVQRFSGGGRKREPERTGRTPVAFRIRATSMSGRRVERTHVHRALTRVDMALARRRARRSA